MNTYEQKYKHALENFKKIKSANSNNKELVNFIEYEYPELKESEDERIRKALIRNYTNQHSSNFPTADGFTREQILAWLEKQGEQKPTNKVEPKFKVGDVIRNKWSNHSKEIVAVDDYQYTLNDGMPAQPFKVDIKEQDNWEIVEQNPAWSEEDEQNLKFWLDNNKSIDSDKRNWLKSLKERVQPQSKQEWSEEDEEKLNSIIEVLGDNSLLVQWLKSLKQQNIWKPSEEQMEALKKRTHGLYASSETRKTLESLINDLEKL